MAENNTDLQVEVDDSAPNLKNVEPAPMGPGVEGPMGMEEEDRRFQKGDTRHPSPDSGIEGPQGTPTTSPQQRTPSANPQQTTSPTTAHQSRLASGARSGSKRSSEESMTESDIEEEIRIAELRMKLKKRREKKTQDSRQSSVTRELRELAINDEREDRPRVRRLEHTTRRQVPPHMSRPEETEEPSSRARGTRGQRYGVQDSSSEDGGREHRSWPRNSRHAPRASQQVTGERNFPVKQGKSYKVAEASLFKKYVGEKDELSIDQWIRMTELILLQINGDERDILYNIPKLFQGGARKWFLSLDDQELADIQSWPEMKKALRENFRSETYEVDMFSKMVTRVLQFDESPIDYFHDKKALCKLADPDISDASVGKHIIQGLPSRFVALLGWTPAQNLKVLQKSLDKRKALLISNHWCEADTNPYKPRRKKASQQNAQTESKKEEKASLDPKGGAPKKTPRTPCKCGGMHFYRECPNGLKAPGETTKSPSVGVNLIELDDDEEGSEDNEEDQLESQDEAELLTVVPILQNEVASSPSIFDAFKHANSQLNDESDRNAVNKDSFASGAVTTPAIMMVKAGLSKHKHRSVVDSGATMSVINPEYHRKHFHQYPILRSPSIGLKGVGQSTAENFVTIPITPQGGTEEKSFDARFYLCDKIPPGIILGLDIMKALGIVVDVKNERLWIDGHASPYPITISLPRKNVPDPLAADHQYDLRTVENVTLQPRTRNRIVVSTTPGGRAQDFLCCPVTIDQGAHAVRAAWTIAPAGSEEVVTEVANLEYEPVTLKKGQTVARVHPLELDDSTVELLAAATAENRKPYSSFEEMVKAMNINPNLTDEQRRLVVDILRKHEKVFANGNVGCSNRGEFHIETGNAKPVATRPYKASPLTRKSIDKMVDDMLERGMWRRTNSPWASPVVPVPQGDKIRICIDYRKVNAVTLNDMTPLPPIDEALHELSNSTWFSTFDANRGYHQIPVTRETGEKLAVTTHRGLFAPNRMMFGPKGAPGFFQALMDEVLKEGVMALP